jgi:predicted HD superfamily hydrolase involved in NAD metabolism
MRQDVTQFLIDSGFPETAAHVVNVADEAMRTAVLFDISRRQAELAGLLHDISTVIPNERRVQAARELDIDLLPEEETFPMIIHQKLSVPIARELFGVTDAVVLSAIECHTTLKGNPSELDKVVFVADKIAWDQFGTPPYLGDLLAALDQSLDQAALVYLDFLWEQRDQLRVVHPWMVAAREELRAK